MQKQFQLLDPPPKKQKQNKTKNNKKKHTKNSKNFITDIVKILMKLTKGLFYKNCTAWRFTFIANYLTKVFLYSVILTEYVAMEPTVCVCMYA